MQSYILVVDDDEIIREFVSTLLADGGYSVQCAANAYQAMQVVESAPPGLLLLDLMMPGVSGAELLARLRRDVRRQNLPVILLSAHPRLREIARDLGVATAIAKPFDNGLLLRQVGQVIGPPIPPEQPWRADSAT